MTERQRAKGGFTIIELMTVVVIIGVLSAVAAVKFNQTLRKSQDGATYGNLGAIRSAVSIYYADVLSQYPSTLGDLTVNAKYLRSLPETMLIGYHQDSTAVKYVAGFSEADDAGGWCYNNAPTDANYGKIFINCTHTDSKSSAWTAY